MFVYEKDGKLNIKFGATQIPAGENENADVIVWKDADGVHAQIGTNKIDG